jgi:hypothetical protein
MNCASCQSANQAEFTSEMVIHFAGLGNIDHPGIPVFPDVLVCLNCGASQFAMPEGELALLASRASTRKRVLARGARSPELRIPPGISD